MATYNDKTEDQKGRQIHPVLLNTAKDGSGTWYVALVDASGRIVLGTSTAVIGKVRNNPTYSVATGSAAIAKTVAPGAAFRLLRVELHLDSAPASTAEDFTVDLDAGDGAAYDTQLVTLDLYTNAIQDLIRVFGEGFEFEADDEIDIAWANTPTETYGLRVVYELL